MRLFMFAASGRKDSVNQKLITLCASLVPSLETRLPAQQAYVIDTAKFDDFDVPLYNGDANAAEGLPAGALSFIERMQKAEGLIISVPEYNFSIPGTLKNLIDWVSRASPMPWQRKPILLMSASPSLVGGNRGLWSTRIPLEACGALVYPDMFSLPDAYNAFDASFYLKDEGLSTRLENLLREFLVYLHHLFPDH